MKRTLTRVCTKCGVRKNLKDFYFRRSSNSHYAHCKDCHKEMASKGYYARVEEILHPKGTQKDSFNSGAAKELTRDLVLSFASRTDGVSGSSFSLPSTAGDYERALAPAIKGSLVCAERDAKRFQVMAEKLDKMSNIQLHHDFAENVIRDSSLTFRVMWLDLCGTVESLRKCFSAFHSKTFMPRSLLAVTYTRGQGCEEGEDTSQLAAKVLNDLKKTLKPLGLSARLEYTLLYFRTSPMTLQIFTIHRLEDIEPLEHFSSIVRRVHFNENGTITKDASTTYGKAYVGRGREVLTGK